ncbi:hypothetical protein EBB79_08125 [Parasedimentitalea marina]|uniref:HTH cro/C1-type domain-containing protein n=1 Tax=Parasedimentitalea marina TaxID=2483033 RepID=A0A3T0N1G4_9RHOB|nr:hypothetical protein [Parasedimentitalea marina]AZV77863.1 hypothetical protein EBB79_08125 [Parasedimentitalea marina]
MTLITPQECTNKRRKLGIPQTALCELAGLRSNYICRFEGDKILEPSGKKLVAISNALRAFEIAKSNHPFVDIKELIVAAQKELPEHSKSAIRQVSQQTCAKDSVCLTKAAS